MTNQQLKAHCEDVIAITDEKRRRLIEDIESRIGISEGIIATQKKIKNHPGYEDLCDGLLLDRIALAALTQPASPALKLPDGWVAVPREATSEMIESGWTYSVLEKNATAKGTWDCMVAAAPTAPHTAPIEPICATGGAEWVSNERVEEIVYRAEMFGHGAGYLPDEVIPMANELLALRKAFTQPIVWIHQTTGAKLNNSVIEDVRKQSGAWIPLYRQPNLPL